MSEDEKTDPAKPITERKAMLRNSENTIVAPFV